MLNQQEKVRIMIINEKLEKRILQRLNGVSPNAIPELKDVLQGYENLREICDHLFHFRDKGWVEFKDASSADSPGCIMIKITEEGKKYLTTLS
jgi:hypothetical protein